MGRKAMYGIVISHRSGGESERYAHCRPCGRDECGTNQDGFHVPNRSGWAKYNQLLRINEELGASAVFAGSGAVEEELTVTA